MSIAVVTEMLALCSFHKGCEFIARALPVLVVRAKVTQPLKCSMLGGGGGGGGLGTQMSEINRRQAGP